MTGKLRAVFHSVCCDAPERSFQASKEPFDLGALTGEAGVEIFGEFAVGSGRDHVNSTLLPDPSPDPIGFLCSVGWHVSAPLQRVRRVLAVGAHHGPARVLIRTDREAILIGNGMTFRPQPAARAPEATTRVVFRTLLQTGEPGQTGRLP